MASNKEKQRLFALYKSQNLSDKEAYIKAGYNVRNIKTNLYKVKETFLKNMDIEKISVEMAKNALVSNKNNTLDLTNIATKEQILNKWTEWLNDTDINIALRIKVSELLAKANGMFTTKIEIKNDNYSDMLNKARNRLQDINTINITPDNTDNINTDNIVN